MSRALFEPLESRKLFSAIAGFEAGEINGPAGPARHDPMLRSITLDQAPEAVQTGLATLATNANVTLATDQKVFLGYHNGTESYSVVVDGTGTITRLTVDQDGNALTAPTRSEITWADLNGTGADANSAAAAEISAIASALELTAPTDTTTVHVLTNSDGSKIYNVRLARSATADEEDARPVVISVDSNGNPVGQQLLPLSVLPTAVQTALNANMPTGATALTADAKVRVRTIDGVTTYSARFDSAGTETVVTVDVAGNLVSLPTHTTTTFDQLSSTVQSALQALASGAGVTDAIGTSQTVDVLTETSGTVLYSVHLETTVTDADGDTHTRRVVITVDADGNPTTLPGGGPGGHDHPQPPPPPQGSTSDATTDGDSTSSASVEGTGTLPPPPPPPGGGFGGFGFGGMHLPH